MLVLLLTACAGKGDISVDEVSKALQKQGLDVEEMTLDAAKKLSTSPAIAINGKDPVPFELSLPAADMAYREFLLLYVFASEEERIRIEKEDGTPAPIKIGELHANVIKKKNLIAVYWSHNKDNPLLMKQVEKAMDKL